MWVTKICKETKLFLFLSISQTYSCFCCSVLAKKWKKLPNKYWELFKQKLRLIIKKKMTQIALEKWLIFSIVPKRAKITVTNFWNFVVNLRIISRKSKNFECKGSGYWKFSKRPSPIFSCCFGQIFSFLLFANSWFIFWSKEAWIHGSYNPENANCTKLSLRL